MAATINPHWLLFDAAGSGSLARIPRHRVPLLAARQAVLRTSVKHSSCETATHYLATCRSGIIFYYMFQSSVDRKPENVFQNSEKPYARHLAVLVVF